MRSRWNDAEAARFTAHAANAALGERLYTSRLLGAERALVLYGGGNTSVKIGHGEQAQLYVKGSGSDLACVRESDFAAMRLADAHALSQASQLDNDSLRRALARITAHPGPGASIETLMHALLPWPYVEHTHADSILAITNTVHGERIAAELFGDLAPLVPFHPSGFALAKACDTVYRTQAGPRTIGLILLHHGVVAFGCNARESYEHMLALVTRAEAYLQSHQAWDLPRDTRCFDWDIGTIARLRRALSQAAGFPLLMAAQEGEHWQAFARRADLAALCTEGPATPQHAVFLRAQPLVGSDIAAYAQRYRALVQAAYPDTDADSLGLDYAPRAIIDPKLGVWVAAVNARHLTMASEILQQDLEIKCRAAGHDRYRGLPPAENIAAEIHYGGFERRLRAEAVDTAPLLGEVALICTYREQPDLGAVLSNAGAAVVTAAQSSMAPAAVREAVRRFGGVDVLIVDQGNRALLDATIPALKAAPRGGRAIVIASTESDATDILQHCHTLGLATTLLPAERLDTHAFLQAARPACATRSCEANRA